MSNMLGQAAGYGAGQVTQGPTLEDAHKAAQASVEDILGGWQSFLAATGPESAAFRSQVFSNLASNLMGAAYNLQRAAYEKATK